MCHHLKPVLLWFILAGVMIGLSPPALAQQESRVEFNAFSHEAFPELGLTVTVINDSGVPYLDLSADNFELFEDGQSLPANQFRQITPNPDVKISVVLAIDGSGSMGANNFQPWNDAKQAAQDFLDTLGAQDEAALIVFGDSVNIDEQVIDPIKEADFTTDKNSLKAQIDALPNPVVNVTTTPLYDAAYKSVNLADQNASPDSRRAVILFTDGREGDAAGRPVSQLDQEAAINQAQIRRLPVFTIRLGEQPDPTYLQRLARVSGGEYMEATAASDLLDLYQRISDRLKTQYQLTLTSNIQCDNNEHKLDVKVSTVDGDIPPNTRTFEALCPITPGIQLFYERPSEETGQSASREPLPANFEVPDSPDYANFVIIPRISSRHDIDRVEYFIDGSSTPEFVATNAPFGFTWNNTAIEFRDYAFRVVAHDEEGNVGEKTLTITGGGIQGGLPPWLWIGAILALIIGLIVMALVIRGYFTKQEIAARPAMAGGPSGPGLPSPRPRPVLPPQASPTPFPALPNNQPGQAALPALASTQFDQPAPSMPTHTKPPFSAGPMSPGASNTGAFLVMAPNNQPAKQYALATHNTLGRDATQCNVVIEDTSVSRQHARIKQEGPNTFVIYDLSSTNPVRLNGQAISRFRLEDGDKIELGRVQLTFKQVKSG